MKKTRTKHRPEFKIGELTVERNFSSNGLGRSR